MTLPDPNLTDYNFTGAVQYLFNRAWAVSIGVPGQLGKEYASNQKNPDVVGGVMDGIKIGFDITKTSESNSNKSKIEITNLSNESRNQYVKGGQITLQAGYVGALETLFIGQFKRTTNLRKGADITTTFECGDGEEQIYNNFFNKSYPPGTNSTQVIQDLIGALGLKVGVISGLKNQIFNKNLVITGGVKDKLDTLLKNQSLEWSVHNGIVQIIPIDSHNGDTAVVVSQDTGLIGIPTPPSGGDNIVSFTSLLNPKLFPGVPVSLQSTNTEVGNIDPTTGLFTGLYKVRTSHFEGDSHEGKWQVTCECEPLTNFRPAPNQNKAGKIKVANG